MWISLLSLLTLALPDDAAAQDRFGPNRFWPSRFWPSRSWPSRFIGVVAPAKRYQGKTAAEWQDAMRAMLPSDPASGQAVPGLIELLRDRDAPDLARKQAALTLGRIGAPAAAAIPVLEEIVRRETAGDEAAPRCWAAKGLALFRSRSAATTPTLVAILRDPKANPSHRQAMLDPLAAIGGAHPDVVPALVELLQSGEDPPGVPLRELSLEVAMVMGSQADPLVPLLVRILRQPREAASMRRKSANALGTMGLRAEPALTALAESVVADQDESVRDAAADAIGRVGAAALPLLGRLATSTDAGVRWRAARALGSMGQFARPAAPALQKLVADREPIVRITACEAWWLIFQEGKGLVPLLASLLADDDRAIRMRSLKQLTLMPREREAIRDAVEPLTRDEREPIRTIAERLLQKLEAAP